MQNPSKAHARALKRLGRFLIGRTRYVILFRRQGERVALHTQVDTDHAGCLKTRKSTSGGIPKLGRHTIRTWSLTQAEIALSSGEAEYYGVVNRRIILSGYAVIIEGHGDTCRSAHVHGLKCSQRDRIKEGTRQGEAY